MEYEPDEILDIIPDEVRTSRGFYITVVDKSLSSRGLRIAPAYKSLTRAKSNP